MDQYREEGSWDKKTTWRESSGFPKFFLGTLFLKLTVFQKQDVHSSNRHGLIESYFHSKP